MLEAYFLDLGWLLFALFFGVAMGSLTGLIPGFHVNNVALILLALSPVFLSWGIPLSAVAAIIVSTGTVHTFLNYIPSALLGAPDGDTALSLLPGHRMLLSGNAPRGVAWSARGSQLGLFLSLPLIIVARIAFGDELGWYDYLRNIIFFLLLGISFLLLATETTRLDWPKWLQKLSMNKLATDSRFAGFLAATGFFLLSGFYGWAVFSLPARSPVGIPDASLLLPSLAGLFGIANLLDIYATTSHIPPQNEDWTLPPAKPLLVPCFWSGVAGASMGVLPGMTASQATVLVMGGRNVAAKVQGKEGYGMDWETRRLTEMTDEELLEIALSEAEGGVEGPQTKQDLEVIAILSAVNTAVTVMVLGFLYIIGRSRSGATLALKMMYPIDTWSSAEPTADFVRLIAVTIAAGLMAMPIMRVVGKGMLRLHAAIPLQQMVMGVIIFVSALVWFTTGFIGIGVLIIGTILGLIPPRVGIRRSHGMGIIIVPIMIYTFSQAQDAFGFL
ncbi:MAG: tripartite tricarboxylate transporter permease [Candidatus Thermoplasmatota archaeon]|nr:tripartite tricarboxylate transporter permease [Candidatus Poseidoniaceae archaeon]MEC7589556.1 tripartite tricarboxylate transporter permease [Candidatus Thermoplasmatota archaeon]